MLSKTLRLRKLRFIKRIRNEPGTWPNFGPWVRAEADGGEERERERRDGRGRRPEGSTPNGWHEFNQKGLTPNGWHIFSTQAGLRDTTPPEKGEDGEEGAGERYGTRTSPISAMSYILLQPLPTRIIGNVSGAGARRTRKRTGERRPERVEEPKLTGERAGRGA